ncbi:MAG: peptide chain release factor 1 [Clostridiales bacterium]|jgi:peptide chain release factor 1|nr:peptide chain release factor 1 [Clostridiales bacterium]
MNIIKLQSIKDKYLELSKKAIDSNIIGTQSWTEIVKEQANLQPIVEIFDMYLNALANCQDAKAFLNDSDAELAEIANMELLQNTQKLIELEQQLKILLLPTDPDDNKNTIIEIRAGAGGEEAALFASVLMRMYKMFADSKHWKIEDIDISDTGIGGIKEAIFSIKGNGVYGTLKYESGVHRVQRVPATETQGRVHTSTVTVAVLPEAEEVEVEVLEKDLRIDTYRSGGAGGQHVNKTESAIRITHIPTGIVVQCQDEKSQIKNRDKAMRTLKTKLYDFYKNQAEREYASNRKAMVGTGDRSERIRTYNYSQGRVTDHRINMTLYSLEDFINGNIEKILQALALAEQTAKLEQGES